MRPVVIALVAALTLACGDEPEEAGQEPPSRPTPARPAADTTLGDTVAAPADTTAAAPAPGADAGEAGGGRAAASRESGGAETASGGAEATPASGRLYTIQVAAFTEPRSATEWTDRLSGQGMPVWTSMAEIGGRTFYRVRVGAVRSFSDARRLGSLISTRYDWPVWVAPVTAADQVPQDAVSATRRVLEGG